MSLLELLRVTGLVGTAVPAQATLTLGTAEIDQVPGVKIALSGAGAGLIHASSPLPRTLNVTVEGQGRPAAGATGAHDVLARIDKSSALGITGVISRVTPLPASGAFSAQVDLIIDGAAPRPRRFELQVELREDGVRAARRSVVLEVVDIAGFAALMDGYEARWTGPPGATSADFIAAPRKVLLPSGDFEIVLGRHAPIQPLFKKGTPSADWLKDHWATVLAGSELVNIGHALIGIEGADRFNPQPTKPIPRVDLLVVWAGDLGSVLRAQAYDRYLLPVANPPTLREAYDLQASRSQLLGDIDGVNLAGAYDETKTLADNLRSFYGFAGYKRFSDFVANTRKDDGGPALVLQPSVSPPRLTQASRDWIAEQVHVLGSLATLARIMRDQRLKNKTIPPAVNAMFEATSPEMQQVVGWFVELIEQGLAAETAP